VNRLRKVLLTVVAAGALSTAPVALAGGPNDGNNDHGNNDHGNKGNSKTTICHATGSETNPYVQITVSNNALAAHKRHQGGRDIIPAPEEGCPPGEKTDDCEKHHGKKHQGKKHHGKKHDDCEKGDDGKKEHRH
jgi:hypothetical protein